MIDNLILCIYNNINIKTSFSLNSNLICNFNKMQACFIIVSDPNTNSFILI